MEKVIAKASSDFWIEKGKSYWFRRSSFCGGCYHIYAANNYDSHLCNIFSDEEFHFYFD